MTSKNFRMLWSKNHGFENYANMRTGTLHR